DVRHPSAGRERNRFPRYLMSIAPFEHPFLLKLLGDREIAGLLSAEADIAQMLAFEAALARAEAETGVVPHEAADDIVRAIDGFVPDMNALAVGAARDGVVAPDLVAQLRKTLPEDVRPHLHFGATSQDVIDTSLIIRIKSVL